MGTLFPLIGEWEMQDLRTRAETYRARAAEMRTLAEADKLPETRDQLMIIAADYERLAKSLDAFAKSKDALIRN
jgi:hypothetical protein